MIVIVGVGMMLPAFAHLWNVMLEWLQPTPSLPDTSDFENIIEELRETSATLHTNLENWRVIANEKEGEVKDLQADKVALEIDIETLRGEVLHQKGRAASAHTTRGQLLEKWTPFVSAEGIDEHWRVEDWQFLGAPIDYVVFDWRQDKVENLTNGKIVLLDVKSGKSQLTSKQRRIRDLIKAGRVEWREIRLD